MSALEKHPVVEAFEQAYANDVCEQASIWTLSVLADPQGRQNHAAYWWLEGVKWCRAHPETEAKP